MKKTILALSILCASSAFANYGWTPPSKPEKPTPTKTEPKAPEPKAPEVKTPSTPEPKAPEQRSQSRSDAHDRPCERPVPPFWCPKPVPVVTPEPVVAPVAPLPEPVQVITVVVREACTEVKFFPSEKKAVKKAVKRKPAATSCAVPKL